MPTPKEGYYVDGKRVPGTTTIINSFKDSGGLIYWAWKIPFDGLTEARFYIDDLLNGKGQIEKCREFIQKPLSEWDYKTKRDKAADAGTCAHDMMDCHVHGRTFDASQYTPEIIKLAEPAFGAFCKWAGQVKFQICETEVALTSRKYLFGGTRDGILIDGKRALADWKTSKGVYPDMLCQLAAYGILDEEAGFGIEAGYHLLRFSKQEKPEDPVHFSHHYWSQLDKGKAAFLLMRQLYDLMKDLKGLAK